LYNLEMCTASVQLKGAHEARLAARLRSSWAAVGSWMDSTLSSVRMESIHKGPSNHKKEAVQAPAPASAAGQASATAAKVLRRMRAYVLSNGLPLSVGSVCWLWLESTRKDMGSASDVAHMMLCQCFHLAAMVLIAHRFSRGRRRVVQPAKWWDMKSPHGLLVADMCSSWIVLHTLGTTLPSFSWSSLITFFAYRLLLMELVFDFLHYCMHRLCHEVPWLYVNIHKIHHNHHGNLHVGSTLQMHPVDGLLTNTLPLLMAVFLVPIASHWEFHAYMAYKTAQELFGHCGVQIKVKSFPSNPWLVELLKIDLQVADHTMHHIDGRVNFGKRLSAWDRLFDTFKPASTLHEQKKNFQ